MRQDAWGLCRLWEKGQKENAIEKEAKLVAKYIKNSAIFDRILTEQKHKRGVSF